MNVEPFSFEAKRKVARWSDRRPEGPRVIRVVGGVVSPATGGVPAPMVYEYELAGGSGARSV